VPQLKSIYFYACGDCNLKCRHCWIEPPVRDSKPKYTPWSILRPIFEEGLALGLSSVKLTGGEPCLHPEISLIIDDLAQMGLKVSMETNATLLTPEIVKSLKQAKAFVAVSLDGSNKELHEGLRGIPGSFRKAIDGISLLKKAGIRFQIICSLHKGNMKKLGQMPEFVAGLGGASLKVNPITGLGRSADMERNNELLSLEDLLKFYDGTFKEIQKSSPIPIFFDIPPAFKSLTEISDKKLGVCGILSILGILHDGSAGLCGIGERVEELNFGNPLQVGLKKIWEDTPLLNKIRNQFPDNLKGVCSRCKMKAYCFGKCMAHTYSKTGDVLNGYPLCEAAFRLGVFPKSRFIEKL
jgi:SynChlorMet cassette radical SAM/SPASM protein ScmF